MATNAFTTPSSRPLPHDRTFHLRVSSAVQGAVRRSVGPSTPPRLAEAIEHAVCGGGGRLRPQLCVLAAMATGDGDPHAADAAAGAIELLHCASLVHDDMPCFDDADTRRGLPSVHKKFGEATALLVGDALIVQAFGEIAGTRSAGELVRTLAEAAGAARGIIAGQAWEGEPRAPLDEYHRAKTASLFEAAAAMGALTSGADPAPWRAFGEALGRAYQAADDLADAEAEPGAIGKPTGRDALLDRPSVVRELGIRGARARAMEHLMAAFALVPEGPSARLVIAWVEHLATRAGIR